MNFEHEPKDSQMTSYFIQSIVTLTKYSDKKSKIFSLPSALYKGEDLRKKYENLSMIGTCLT